MSESSLQDRLREHAKAFDGLLSLIPAKMYYGEDTSDQWRKRKQTKAEAKAAKRGKLDPDSELNRNAKEVMDEKARNKRKLREMEEDGDGWEEEKEEEEGANHQGADGDQESLDNLDIGPVGREKPGEGLKKKPTESETSNKKQKVSDDAEDTPKPQSAKQQAKEEKKLANKQKKAERKQKKGEKTDDDNDVPQSTSKPPREGDQEPAGQPQKAGKDDGPDDNDDAKSTEREETHDANKESDLQEIDVAGLVDQEDDATSASTPASEPNSPIFDTQPNSNNNSNSNSNNSAEPASATTSISSTIAPSEKPKHIKLPTDTTALRARLAAKIEALRAARKADADGKPIRTRQELIESRREKQAQRKAHKKELRRVAKVEEERKREEALASARNSPAMLSPLVGLGGGGGDDDDDGSANHFAFGRVAFADGTQMSHDLSYEKDAKKRGKGPSDPKTALAKLEAQKRRVEGLDEDKRKEVLEKEAWLAARRRAEGERIRDNEGLLKKAVKRKEKAKKKSEREWKERSKGVEAAMQERQRKREENLRKRREEKGAGKGKKKGVASKKKNRPGFEGSFSIGGKR